MATTKENAERLEQAKFVLTREGVKWSPKPSATCGECEVGSCYRFSHPWLDGSARQCANCSRVKLVYARLSAADKALNALIEAHAAEMG